MVVRVDAEARLADALESASDRVRSLRVTALPDANVDHFVVLPSVERFQQEVAGIHGRGGGGRVASGQRLQVGGNAANLVHALARLGVRCSLVARCDGVGEALLRETFQGLPVDLGALTRSASTATTVALEFPEANVMLSDPGPHGEMGPKDLGVPAWRCIEASDAVAVVNWSQTRHGTRLLEAVLPRAKAAGALTFMDTGDPTGRPGDAALLLGSPALDALDVWSMNAVEARFFGGLLGAGRDVEACARAVARRGRFTVDLHMGAGAARLSHQRTWAPSFDGPVQRRTGAGDAWNAGDLLGRLLGLDASECLSLGHAVAALWVSLPQGGPPDLEQVIGFLRDAPARVQVVAQSAGRSVS